MEGKGHTPKFSAVEGKHRERERERDHFSGSQRVALVVASSSAHSLMSIVATGDGL